MKKTIIVIILILLLAGVIYLGLWAVGGMGIGNGGSQKEMNNTQNSDSQSGSDAAYLDESSLGNNSTSTERSGIVIDKALLNQKIVIPTGETEKSLIGTSSKVTATSTKTMATSTNEIKPEIASTTESIKTASSSILNLVDSTQDASNTKVISQ